MSRDRAATSDRGGDPDRTINYQPVHHTPRQKRLAAVVTGAAGVVSLCIGAGLGVVALAAVVVGDFGIAAGMSGFFSLLFIVCAVILFRQANNCGAGLASGRAGRTLDHHKTNNPFSGTSARRARLSGSEASVMAARSISLQQIRVAEPCPMSWDDLKGDDRARFCAHCNRHVHNLSAMPEDQAQRLVCESAGRLCIAYLPNEQGGVTPLEYAKQKRPRYGWRLVAAVAGLGGITSALATMIYRPTPPAAVPLGKMMVLGGAPAMTISPAVPVPAPAPSECDEPLPVLDPL